MKTTLLDVTFEDVPEARALRSVDDLEVIGSEAEQYGIARARAHPALGTSISCPSARTVMRRFGWTAATVPGTRFVFPTKLATKAVAGCR